MTRGDLEISIMIEIFSLCCLCCKPRTKIRRLAYHYGQQSISLGKSSARNATICLTQVERPQQPRDGTQFPRVTTAGQAISIVAWQKWSWKYAHNYLLLALPGRSYINRLKTLRAGYFRGLPQPFTPPRVESSRLAEMSTPLRGRGQNSDKRHQTRRQFCRNHGVSLLQVFQTYVSFSPEAFCWQKGVPLP